jgi:hypothetical protein
MGAMAVELSVVTPIDFLPMQRKTSCAKVGQSVSKLGDSICFDQRKSIKLEQIAIQETARYRPSAETIDAWHATLTAHDSWVVRANKPRAAGLRTIVA